MDFVADEAPDGDVHKLLIPMCSFAGWCSPRPTKRGAPPNFAPRVIPPNDLMVSV
jgi:hypothetical protein